MRLRPMLRLCRSDCEYVALRGLACKNDDPRVKPFLSDCPRYTKKRLEWWDF